MASTTPTPPSTSETAREFFGLVWPGKEAARAAASAPLTQRFKRDSALSTACNTDNAIIAADNLPVLQELAARREVFDVIYICLLYTSDAAASDLV